MCMPWNHQTTWKSIVTRRQKQYNDSSAQGYSEIELRAKLGNDLFAQGLETG